MEVGGPVTVTDVQVQFDFQANSSMTITISGTKVMAKKGGPTEMGSPIYRGNRPPADAACVAEPAAGAPSARPLRTGATWFSCAGLGELPEGDGRPA